jgi:hypothetical protein
MKQMFSWEVISLELSTIILRCRETKYTLPYSQQSSTEFYPAPVESNQT